MPCTSTDRTKLINGGPVTASNFTTLYTASAASGSVAPTSCLPAGGAFTAVSDLETNGNVKTARLQTHVAGLITTYNATVPGLATNDLALIKTFQTNTAKLRDDIKKEYCYYYSIYEFILNDYLVKAASAATAADAAAQLVGVVKINTQLNQILQIYQALINSRNTSLRAYYTGTSNLNTLNTEIGNVRTTLKNQALILESATSDADIKSAMIEYSIEKNQSSRNLLAIYGFMNIVAVGLIFYLYRSAKSQ
jgi:hypothetical protein